MLSKYIIAIIAIVSINNTSYSTENKIEDNNSKIKYETKNDENALDNGYYKDTIIHYKEENPKYIESRRNNFPSKEEIKNKIYNNYNYQLQYIYYLQLTQINQYWNGYYNKFTPYYNTINNKIKKDVKYNNYQHKENKNTSYNEESKQEENNSDTIKNINLDTNTEDSNNNINDTKESKTSKNYYYNNDNSLNYRNNRYNYRNKYRYNKFDNRNVGYFKYKNNNKEQ